MYHYDHRDFEMVSRTFKRKEIESDIDRAEQRKREAIENADKYIAACQEQLRKIDETEFKRHIYVKRERNWAINKIQLFVGLLHYPDIEDGERFGWVELDTAKTFKGTERRQAREYAEQLAAEYGCEVKMEGF